MTLAAAIPFPASLRTFLSMDSGATASNAQPGDHASADRARRDFFNALMCDHPGAVEGEYGMQAMMSFRPQEF